VQSWLPKNPRAALIISHGYAEHASRYAPFAEFLTQHDVAVYALDHRGHGKSEGESANVRVFRELVDDLLRFIESVREQQPQLERFLLGHSVGAVVATQLILEHPHKVEGLLLSGAYLKSAVEVSPLLMAVSGFLSRYFPSLPTLKVNTHFISRDAAIVKAYETDQRIYHGGTKARMGVEFTNAGPYVLSRAESIKLPILVMHGTQDGIADFTGSKVFFEKASSLDKTLKLYEGYYHEILNDTGKETVYQDVLEWLQQRIED
jgi:alpha-beta hydrolase superfamily lysophospholipase